MSLTNAHNEFVSEWNYDAVCVVASLLVSDLKVLVSVVRCVQC